MPNYDFHCMACGVDFTTSLSISQRGQARCERCGSRDLKQRFKNCNLIGGGKGRGLMESVPVKSCSHTGGCGGCSGCH